MFAPSPSPSHSPTLLSRSRGSACNAQPAALSRARPPFSPRQEARRAKSPRMRVDDPIQSVIAFQSRSPILLQQHQQFQPQQQQKRSADAGTQYTPPGIPPTAHTATPHQRSGAVKDSSTQTPSRPEDNERDSSKTKSGGRASADLADPLAGPSSDTTRSRSSHHHAANSDAQNGEHVGVGASEAGVPGKTPGETRTRVKDVIGPPGEGRKMDSDNEDDGVSSSSKKQRQDDPPVKIMPLKYEDCDMKDLGLLVSDMLLELVRHNDGLPLKDGQLTRFHSRAPPGISISDYLNRLITHASLTPPLLLSMVYYIDRLCALYPVFTISSLTVHRFLIAAATVAAKGLSDSFWTNNTYARVGGVTTRELALLELEFLEKMQWRIVPKPEVLRDYYRSLVGRGEGYVMERPGDEKSNDQGTDKAPEVLENDEMET